MRRGKRSQFLQADCCKKSPIPRLGKSGILIKINVCAGNQFEFLPPRFTCSGFSDFQNANSQFVNLVTKIVWLER
jgi:hypothetical protein